MCQIWHISALLCVLLPFQLTTCEEFYVLMAPNILHTDNVERIVIQGHECRESQQVKIYVRSFPKEDQILHQAHATLNSSNAFLATINIQVPTYYLSSDLKEKQYVVVHAELQSHRNLNLKKVILLSPNIGHIFIQTDKTIYTPNQNVNYRILTTNQNLDPIDGNVDILLQNPEGIIVNRENVKILTGLQGFPLQLPELVSFGTWKLVAKFQDAPQKEYSTQFEVQEYVLPTFSVELHTDKKYFYFEDEELVVHIKARYLFEKNVNGYAIAIFGLYKDFMKTLPSSMQRVQIINGEGLVQLSNKELFEDVNDKKELLGASIYVNVTVFSSEGDHVQVHKTNIKIVSSPYNIAFTRTPSYFKPGWPMKITVLVTNPDMTPAADVYVRCDNSLGRTSQDGMAVLSFNTKGSDKDLTITVKTEDDKLQDEQQAKATLKAKAYNALFQSLLHIDVNSDGQNSAFVTINIKSQNEEDKQRIKYFTLLVISRGQILKTMVIRREGNQHVTVEKINLSSEMMPSFRIVGYFYLFHGPNLELVSDSVWLHMKRSCKGTLKLKIDKNKIKPQDQVELTVTGDSGSFVGITAVDKAVFVLNNKTKFSQDKVWDEMEENDPGCSAGSGADLLGVFQDAGLDFVTTTGLATPSRKDISCTSEHKRKRRSYELSAAKQKKASEAPAHLRPCCLAGLHENPMGLDCATRKQHVQLGKECVDIFFDCCTHAETLKTQLREELEWDRSDDTEEDFEDDSSPRSYFPESKVWRMELKNEKSNIVTIPVPHFRLPDSITTWVIQAVSIKKDKGICVSDPLPVTIFKDFFVDLRVPHSIRTNEQVQIRAVVHNYHTEKLQVKVKFLYNENFCSLATKSKGYQETVYVAAHSTKVVHYVIIPLKGIRNELEVHAQARKNSFYSVDKVTKAFDVLPEGKYTRKTTFSQIVNPEGGSRLIPLRREELDGIVPNSDIKRFISTQGDIMGESLLGILDESYLGQLIYVPSGCPEQNIFSTTPNVIVTHYLDANKKWDVIGAEKRLKAIDHIKKGYTKQLTHLNSDHSFQKSTWLTAYVVKVFAKAFTLVFIDKDMLCNSSMWLASKQNSDGEFIENGIVYAKAMQGGYIGSEASSSLTAFVLIALDEVKDICNISDIHTAIKNATEYLEKKLPNLKNTYSAVITSYALALVGSTGNENIIDSFAAKDDLYWPVDNSNSFTVEATGYALLQKLKLGKSEEAHKIANWLICKRSFGGGYESTQATVIALQALTKYRNSVTDKNTNLVVQLDEEGRSQTKKYVIQNQDAYLQRTDKFQGNNDITVNITGRGECTLTVMTVYYSMLNAEKKCNGFTLQAEVKADEEKADTHHLILKTRYNGLMPATMTLIEITMLTGFSPNIDDLKKLASKVENYIMLFEVQAQTSNASVVLYLKEVPNNDTLTIGFRIHNNFEVGLLQPADVSIYEYYDLDKKCSTFYNLPSESGQLRKICKGSVCKCAVGDCASLSKVTDVQSLKEKACSDGMYIVFKVHLANTERKASYDYFTVTILEVIKDEPNMKIRNVNATMNLISHMACSESLKLQSNADYLLMNRYADLWEDSAVSSFILNSQGHIFAWPQGDKILEDFTHDMIEKGCDT